MSSKLLIRQSDGLILNRIELEDGAVWEPPAGTEIVADDEAFAIGGTLVGGVYTPPAPIVKDWDAIDLATVNKALAQNGSVVRALALVMLSELNLHAERVTAILNAADGASNLAGFKTAMAAIPDVPVRTVSQLVTALKANIRS